jgi:hypothetical protein
MICGDWRFERRSMTIEPNYISLPDNAGWCFVSLIGIGLLRPRRDERVDSFRYFASAALTCSAARRVMAAMVSVGFAVAEVGNTAEPKMNMFS